MVVDIQDYSKKLREHASTVEAWDEDKLVGLIAVYCNDYDQKNAFITNVSVLPEYMRKGIAINLMNATIAFVQSSKDFDSIFLEVNKNNSKAIMLYKKCNFETINLFKDIMKMKLILKT
jgi:ribosomal protein S18 acetylase RimI-like enzyme